MEGHRRQNALELAGGGGAVCGPGVGLRRAWYDAEAASGGADGEVEALLGNESED